MTYDLGLEQLPKNTNSQSFAISTNIDAKSLFQMGMKAGKEYELKGNYLILAQSTLSTTATLTALALGYDCLPSVKDETINKTLSMINEDMSSFEKLSIVSDNALIFNAGFLLEASRRFHIVLAGGFQMATVLLIADKLREDVLMRIKSDNITIATWIEDDKKSNLSYMLSLLSYKPHAVYTRFSFKDATIELLKKYDDSELKERAGAALGYACANGVDNKRLLEEIEFILYSI